MENGDNWQAFDKLQHFLLCFSLTIIFALLATRTRYSFIRNHSIWVGSIFSLTAGAAKEIADEMGYFKSTGASAKDAVSDFLGTLVGALTLFLAESYCIQAPQTTDHFDQVKVAEMV